MSPQKEQQYRSWVEVDLDGFTANIQEIKRLVGEKVKILQVVKADAYGHGAIEISHAAVKAGAHCLGVANADEGVQLRVCGITVPVIILSPSIVPEIGEIVKYNLTPSVSDLSFARSLQEECRRAGIRVPIHIEVDTGMGRGGTICSEALKMIHEIAAFPNIVLEGIFTHLSQSERDVEYNKIQWRQFEVLLKELECHNILIPNRHMANSGAVLNYAGFHLDMVRPGLMTYGVYPSPETLPKARLVPVMSFKTRVLLVKDFPEGYSIGYGRTFVTSRPTRIATIPVGYGDGYGVIFSNKGEALIRGSRVPIVGRISMDMCTVDATEVADCEIGDEVVLMGRQGGEAITVDEVAERANTISYEIMCALGKRAPRVFLQKGEPGPVASRLRRIFIPGEEKTLSRIDEIIRGCLHDRAQSEELGDAIYYTMFEALFGKSDRQLELRSRFKYDITLEDSFRDDTNGSELPEKKHFKVTTRIEYYKTLMNNVFMIGCAGNNEQLKALFDDEHCEYRWLLGAGAELSAVKDFRINCVRIDDEEVPLIRADLTDRGYELWYGGEGLKKKLNREVKVAFEIVTKKSARNRDFSVYLVYPVRGLDISFDYGGTRLKKVREVAFFAGRQPSPDITREKAKIRLSISDNEWVFPTSGVTFIWE